MTAACTTSQAWLERSGIYVEVVVVAKRAVFLWVVAGLFLTASVVAAQTLVDADEVVAAAGAESDASPAEERAPTELEAASAQFTPQCEYPDDCEQPSLCEAEQPLVAEKRDDGSWLLGPSFIFFLEGDICNFKFLGGSGARSLIVDGQVLNDNGMSATVDDATGLIGKPYEIRIVGGYIEFFDVVPRQRWDIRFYGSVASSLG